MRAGSRLLVPVRVLYMHVRRKSALLLEVLGRVEDLSRGLDVLVDAVMQHRGPAGGDQRACHARTYKIRDRVGVREQAFNVRPRVPPLGSLCAQPKALAIGMRIAAGCC